MKSILLAAAAMIAMPALAQTTAPADPATTPQTTPPGDSSTMSQTDPAMQGSTTQGTDSSTMAPSTADPSSSSTMAPQSTAPMTSQSTMSPTQTTGGDMPTPAGGYQPTGPAVSGTPAPGATVRFQPAQDPNTAYPPPAPKASYPICKKGQYDGCMQASDMHGSRKAMHRKRR